jgi:hypothetical protein
MKNVVFWDVTPRALTDVSQERIASMIRVKIIRELEKR